jgi:hypothetical protein
LLCRNDHTAKNFIPSISPLAEHFRRSISALTHGPNQIFKAEVNAAVQLHQTKRSSTAQWFHDFAGAVRIMP